MPIDPRSQLISLLDAANSEGNKRMAAELLLKIKKLDLMIAASTPPEPEPLPERFNHQNDIVAYLTQQGWSSNKSTLSRNIQERKLVCQADGSYTRDDIDSYARGYLVNNPDRAEKNIIDELILESKQLENRRLRLKVEQQEGILVNAVDVKREVENMLVSFSARLLRSPRKLSGQLSQMTDADKIVQLLTREIRDCLSILSQYRVNTDEDSEQC